MASYEEKQEFIYISYAPEDREKVFRYMERLRAARCLVWYNEEKDSGVEWAKNIVSRIEKCDGMIAFVSESYIRSGNCRDELEYAKEYGKDRLLVYLEDVTLPSLMALRMERMEAIHSYKYESESDFCAKLMEHPMILHNQEEGRCDEYRREIKRLLCLLEKNPEEGSYKSSLNDQRTKLAGLLLEMGSKLAKAGKEKEAQELLEAAQWQYRYLAEENPESPKMEQYKYGRAFTSMTLAYLLDRHGKGWRWHRAAAVLFDVLQGYPGVDEDRKYRYCIYAALNSVGWAQGLQEKQPGTAEDLYQKAITVFREQAAKYPEREKIKYYLAEYASSFAHFLRGIDQKEDAEKLFREALEVSCRLIREYPENEQYRILARFTVGREMIDLLREMNREEEADKLTDFIVGL